MKLIAENINGKIFFDLDLYNGQTKKNLMGHPFGRKKIEGL